MLQKSFQINPNPFDNSNSKTAPHPPILSPEIQGRTPSECDTRLFVVTIRTAPRKYAASFSSQVQELKGGCDFFQIWTYNYIILYYTHTFSSVLPSSTKYCQHPTSSQHVQNTIYVHLVCVCKLHCIQSLIIS